VGLLDIRLTPGQLATFEAYAALLEQWSLRLNLTGARTLEEIVSHHFLDSLSCLVADSFPNGGSVLDVGSGAGFPGVPIKIARPDLQLTLLEASRRRTAFLDLLITELRIQGEVVHGRAEVLAHQPERRERYDRVLARATASLPLLLELCLPFVRVGGRSVLPKGSRAHEEVTHARKALDLLGGEVGHIQVVSLPHFWERSRNIVVVHKVRPTPLRFPRHAGAARKRPI